MNWDMPFKKLGSAIVDENRIVIAKDEVDFELHIYRIDTKQISHQLIGHTQSAWRILPLPNGNIASWDYKEILIWDPNTSALLHRLPQTENTQTVHMRVLTEVDAKLLAQPLGDGNVHCWNYETGEQIDKLFQCDDPGWYIHAFHQLSDGCWLTASKCSSEAKYRIWSPERNMVLKEFKGDCANFYAYAHELVNGHIAIAMGTEIQIYDRTQNRIVRRALNVRPDQTASNQFVMTLPDGQHMFLVDMPKKTAKVVNALQSDPSNIEHCHTIHTFSLSHQVSRLGILGDSHIIYHTSSPHSRTTLLNVKTGTTLFKDAKIADFGLSRVREMTMGTTTMPDSQVGSKGTPHYMAPELWQGHGATKAVDVYAFAIVLSELVTRARPYHDRDYSNTFLLMAAIIRGERPTIPENCPGRISDLMKNSWVAQLDQRKSMNEVVAELEIEHNEVIAAQAP